MKQKFVYKENELQGFPGAHSSTDPKASSVQEEWHSEIYQRAGVMQLGTEKSLICNGPIRTHQAWKWINYFFQVCDEDII